MHSTIFVSVSSECQVKGVCFTDEDATVAVGCVCFALLVEVLLMHFPHPFKCKSSWKLFLRGERRKMGSAEDKVEEEEEGNHANHE